MPASGRARPLLCSPELLATFSDCLRDSLIHVLFSPSYFLHRRPDDPGVLQPLFGIERGLYEMGRRDARMRGVLARADAVLAAFDRHAARSYLASAFDLAPPPLPDPGHDSIHAHVDGERFDLLDPDDQRRFVRLDPIPVEGSFGVETERRTSVLVLGSYHPATRDYIADLLLDPVSPSARHRTGEPLTEIEKTLLVCDRLTGLGYESVTPMAHRRDVLNVFVRTTTLMAAVDRIVLLLAHGGSGVAMEYGMLCTDPALARKTIVFVPLGEPITGLATYGSFLLKLPETMIYRDEPELLAQIDALFPRISAHDDPAG